MFTPSLPQDPQDGYAYQEFIRLSNYLQQFIPDRLNLIPQRAEPGKPRDGNIVYADGTNWDPGSGAGLYQ